jgi:prevent-host-death family protein
MNMHITVTATEANRSFSKLLREVAKGKRIAITSHGQDVAVLAPAERAEDKEAAREKRLEALAALQKQWAKQPHITIGPWTRDDLYDRDW